jgi:hypothetical protein
LLAEPVSPRSQARLRVHQRKPTACTIPCTTATARAVSGPAASRPPVTSPTVETAMASVHVRVRVRVRCRLRRRRKGPLLQWPTAAGSPSSSATGAGRPSYDRAPQQGTPPPTATAAGDPSSTATAAGDPSSKCDRSRAPLTQPRHAGGGPSSNDG